MTLNRLFDTRSTMCDGVRMASEFPFNKAPVHWEKAAGICKRRMDTTRNATDRDIYQLANA